MLNALIFSAIHIYYDSNNNISNNKVLK